MPERIHDLDDTAEGVVAQLGREGACVGAVCVAARAGHADRATELVVGHPRRVPKRVAAASDIALRFISETPVIAVRIDDPGDVAWMSGIAVEEPDRGVLAGGD